MMLDFARERLAEATSEEIQQAIDALERMPCGAWVRLKLNLLTAVATVYLSELDTEVIEDV